MTQRNFHKYFMIYFITFGIVISSFGSIANYMFQISDIHKSTDAKAVEIFDIKADTILKPALKNMDNVVKALATNETVATFFPAKDANKLQELERVFLTLASAQNKIVQARLLDKDGKELVRIDREKEDDKPFVVAKEELQDKSDREYFKIVSKMKTPAIWRSKMDLNIENGVVEVPCKPTMRFATPLFANGDFIGMVVVNIMIKDLFASIGNSSAFEHFIIDADGNYVMHPDNNFSFNKYKNVPRNLVEDFPEGLSAQGVYAYKIGNILNNGDDAVFILKTKEKYEESLINEKIKTATIVLALTIVLSFIVATQISKTPVKIQKALLKAHDKLDEFRVIIDKYVISATTKTDSVILDVSSAFEKSSGYSKTELIGKKMNVVRHPNEDKFLFKELWKTILKGETWSGEIQNKTKDGEVYWLEQKIIPTFNENNKIESFVSLGIEITAKKKLEKMASIDALTGIYNRRMVDEFIKIEVEAHKRHSYGLSVIMIDIDHFKIVNDVYGHQVGDSVLAKTAKLITGSCRKSDISGRYGGEEFIIFCPQTTSESAFVLAEKIRKVIEAFEFEQVGQKTVSLGVATFDDESNENVASLIKKADTALYQAKNGGRNKTVIFKA